MKICLCDPDEPWQRQIYKDEVDIHKSLDHPNVVQYIDDLQSENMIIIVMEECQGGSLETLLEDASKNHHSTKLPEEQVAPLMAGVVQALHYLHTLDLVHQDIKLGNILIDDNGNAKVADFGMSCYKQNGRKFYGKVKTAYHAPEMANTDALSPAIDAYAFGAILYRLLVGKEYDRQGWPDVATEVARATIRDLLRYDFFDKYIPKEKRSLEGSDHASDTPSKRAARGTSEALEGSTSSSLASTISNPVISSSSSPFPSSPPHVFPPSSNEARDPSSPENDDWWLEDGTEDEEEDDELDDENELETSGGEDDDYGDDDDDAEVKVAQEIEDAQAEEGDKGKEAQKSTVIAEASEETAKEDHDTTNANIAEEKINDKDKKCLYTAHISSDTDNDNASELVNQAHLPDATS
ncbi:Cell cycle serine/threonine-protein kinase cdc5/MSD2 [Linnemannia hyalina]|uniref:Cell cycle serine/threonine-protein kinase cdc5/MSD2 n=1 Tax=Linnemannia hyalina TaxID=64524 RepID=A0A9P7XQF5_9FUNG|nr:Cell cycle serine/threonine-protein kinase cdc5/MSD2 [Linnemannia hyalina]